MLTKRLSLVNAILVLPLSYALLRQADQNVRYGEFSRWAEKTGFRAPPYVKDVFLGLFIVAPLAVAITWLLFRIFKHERRTLANVATVFSATFGVLACFYFLWTLRY